METGGLKVHVDDDKVGRLRVGIGGIVVSTAELTVGDVLLPLALNISVSLIVTKDNGERTTDPGVMLGSSSTLLICVPCTVLEGTKQIHILVFCNLISKHPFMCFFYLNDATVYGTWARIVQSV